jgi:hypothetical protein
MTWTVCSGNTFTTSNVRLAATHTKVCSGQVASVVSLAHDPLAEKPTQKSLANGPDWTGKRHSPQTLIKMKDARRLWWEQHQCDRKRNDKGQFTK